MVDKRANRNLPRANSCVFGWAAGTFPDRGQRWVAMKSTFTLLLCQLLPR
ncbi:MAG: hypothetical protein JWO18_1884 [Microbacteriaceae bacterium]|jgi:hypothetical protein|nr:hypothetical protein [Microbacteriaceae bacterium]